MISCPSSAPRITEHRNKFYKCTLSVSAKQGYLPILTVVPIITVLNTPRDTKYLSTVRREQLYNCPFFQSKLSSRKVSADMETMHAVMIPSSSISRHDRTIHVAYLHMQTAVPPCRPYMTRIEAHLRRKVDTLRSTPSHA